MRKLKLGKRGLSPLVAVIVLLTLVMVLGAIIAGTLSGAPRPVLPATTAVNLVGEYGGNPRAGDEKLIIRSEYGSVIDDAVRIDNVAEMINFLPNDMMEIALSTHWNEMKLLINGEEAPVAILYLTSNGEVKVNCLTPDLNLMSWPEYWVWPATAEEAGAMDFANGDLMVVYLIKPDAIELYLEDPDGFLMALYVGELGIPPQLARPLQSSDLIQLVWEPRDLMLVEYLVQ